MKITNGTNKGKNMSNELVSTANYKSELDYARDMGKMIVKTGKWNKDWNEDTVAVLVLYARDLGIHPVKALMNGFDIIQGKISMKPILMSDMVRKAGHSIQVIQNDAVACILRGTRKDNGDTAEVSFTYEDAKKAKLTGKENYNAWTSDMLFSRCMGRLCRQLFSDIIGGAYTTDEMDDIKHKSNQTEIEVEVSNVDVRKPNKVNTIEAPKKEAIKPKDLTIESLMVELSAIGCGANRVELEKFLDYINVKYISDTETSLADALSSAERLSAFKTSFLAFRDKLARPAIKPVEPIQEVETDLEEAG